MNKKLKLFGILGTLAVAGTAWAMATGGIITVNSTQPIDLNVSAAYPDADSSAGVGAKTASQGFTLSASGTQGYDITLPTGAYITSGEVFSSDYNPSTQVGISRVNQFWQTIGASSDMGQIGGVVASPDNGGFINLGTDQELVLRPGASRAIKGNGNVSEDIWEVADKGNVYSSGQTAGMLRLNGGTTTIYGANNNAPTNDYRNSFNGGTYLNSGHLRVAHTNAFGEGHVMLNGGSHMTVFDSDTSLGEQTFDSPPKSLTEKQFLILRHDPRTVGARLSAPEVLVTVTDVQFTVFSGIREFLTGSSDNTPLGTVINSSGKSYYPGLRIAGSKDSPNSGHIQQVYGTTLVKDGNGKMLLTTNTRGGAWHTRGTHVKAGTLEVTAGGTAKYAASLGATWSNQPDERQNALNQYSNSGMIVPYKNSLIIDEGASLLINRDQFFGHFSGNGSFTANEWNYEGGKRLPQITIQTDATNGNDAKDSDFGAESTFSGPVSGQFDLVLNTAYLGHSSVDIKVVPQYSYYPWRKILSFTGSNNNITKGDTTIVNGILSAATVDNIPHDAIYVGSNANRNGYKLVNYTSEFNTADNSGNGVPATLHANGSFTASNLVTVSTPQMINDLSGRRLVRSGGTPDGYVGFNEETAHAGLAADVGQIMDLSNVEIYNGFIVNERMRLNEGQLSIPSTWNGEVRFSNRYVFKNATRAKPTNVVVDRGVLHLEKTPTEETGVINQFNVQLNAGAALSLGADARDFTSTLTALTLGTDLGSNGAGPRESDQRIRIVVKPEDLKDSKSDARATNAIFNAAYIDYIGLGSGEQNRDNRIVIQLDLSQVGNALPAGKWIKAVYSPNANNYSNLHFLRENSGTSDEDYVKVRVSYGDAGTINGDAVYAVLDENTYAIYVYTKEAATPNDPSTPPTSEDVTPSVPVGLVMNTPTATASSVTVSATYGDSTGKPLSGKTVTFTLTGGASPVTAEATTDANGRATHTFPNLAAKTAYTLAAADKADSTVTAPNQTVTTSDTTTDPGTPGTSTGSSSSGGCDAGFAAAAMLLAADRKSVV